MKRILHVEDDPVNSAITRKLLGKEFEVANAPDGESCLQLLADESFDLILMDVHLGNGKMDGTQALKKIKADPRFNGIPVIALTSFTLPEHEDALLNEGFDDYFGKPVDFNQLIDRINQFLGH